jgi:1-acyl-sn-glycerol-3-phosphate acyltransferase
MKALKKSKTREKIPFWFWFFRWICYVVLRCRCRFRSYGAENVPPIGACIVASNHASLLDPPAVGCGVMHRHVRFMARDTLFSNFVTRWWSRAVGVVPLDRSKGDIAAMRIALKVLKAGGVLSLFPEGTRSPDGRLQSGKGGIGFLIAKGGAPVVPAYVSGTFQALPKGATTIQRHPVSVCYGPPIMPEELTPLLARETRYQDVADLVMQRIAALAEAAESKNTQTS